MPVRPGGGGGLMAADSGSPPAAPATEWLSVTHRFSVSGHKGYLIAATDADGHLVLFEIRMSKAGALLRGVMDALAACITVGLRHGVPVEAFVRELSLMRFEPDGWTERFGHVESIVDYAARWLKEHFSGAAPMPPTPLSDALEETCSVCGLAITWPAGSPCIDCGHVDAIGVAAPGQAGNP